MRLPLRRAASTTTTPSERPLMIRLRMGKCRGSGKRSGRVFRNEQAPLDDRPAQSVIFFGVADIGARAEHGDGPARQIEGGEMCLLVDADGEAGNHGDA